MIHCAAGLLWDGIAVRHPFDWLRFCSSTGHSHPLASPTRVDKSLHVHACAGGGSQEVIATSRYLRQMNHILSSLSFRPPHHPPLATGRTLTEDHIHLSSNSSWLKGVLVVSCRGPQQHLDLKQTVLSFRDMCNSHPLTPTKASQPIPSSELTSPRQLSNCIFWKF